MVVINICKKDLRLAFREIGILLIGIPVLILIGMIYLLFFQKSLSDIDIYLYYAIIMVYLPASLLLMDGLSMIGVLMKIEKDNNVNQVLYSEGIGPSKIFFSKLLAVISVFLVQSMVLILVLNGCYYCKTGSLAKMTQSMVLRSFLVYPLISFALIELYELFMSIFRQTEIFELIVNLGGMALLFYLGIMELEGRLVMDIKLLLIAIIGLIMLNIVIIFIVVKIPKEYMINLGTK